MLNGKPKGEPMTTIEQPLTYSPAEAASELSCHRAHVYKLLAAKAITARRMGSRTLIDGGSLRAYHASLPPYVPGSPIANARRRRKAARSRS